MIPTKNWSRRKNNGSINNELIKHLMHNFFFFHLKFPDVEDIEKQMPGLLKVYKCIKKNISLCQMEVLNNQISRKVQKCRYKNIIILVWSRTTKYDNQNNMTTVVKMVQNILFKSLDWQCSHIFFFEARKKIALVFIKITTK